MVKLMGERGTKIVIYKMLDNYITEREKNTYKTLRV